MSPEEEKGKTESDKGVQKNESSPKKMRIREIYENYKMVGNDHVEPQNKIVTVEGDFDQIIYNFGGQFAGYLNDANYYGKKFNVNAGDTDKKNIKPKKKDKDDKDIIRIYFPNASKLVKAENLKIADMQFLLFKHVIVTGVVELKRDQNLNDSYDTRELQITVSADNENHDVRVVGESTSKRWALIAHDMQKHKLRDLPRRPLKIAVVSSAGSQGCHNFSRIIKEDAYKKLNYFCLTKFTVENIKKQVEDIVNQGEYNCLCIVRGGGPSESLGLFNDLELVESLQKARKKLYVVTGIGHSTDYTNCDEVADYCAYTPTDAAYFLNKSIG